MRGLILCFLFWRCENVSIESEEALRFATHTGDVTAVEQLLNEVSYVNSSLLTHALMSGWNHDLQNSWPLANLSSYGKVFNLLFSHGLNTSQSCPLGPLLQFSRNRNIQGFKLVLSSYPTLSDVYRCIAQPDVTGSVLLHYIAETPSPGLSRILLRIRHEAAGELGPLASALGFSSGFPDWEENDIMRKDVLEAAAGAPELEALQPYLDALSPAQRHAAVNTQRLPFNFTPLEVACRHGRWAVQTWLRRNGGVGERGCRHSGGSSSSVPHSGGAESAVVQVFSRVGEVSESSPAHTLPPPSSFNHTTHRAAGWAVLSPQSLQALGLPGEVLGGGKARSSREDIPNPQFSPSLLPSDVLPLEELSLSALTLDNRVSLEEKYLIPGRPFIIRSSGPPGAPVLTPQALFQVLGGAAVNLSFGPIPYAEEYNRGGGRVGVEDFVGRFMGMAREGAANQGLPQSPPPLVFDAQVLEGSGAPLSNMYRRRLKALFPGPIGLSQLTMGPPWSGSALHFHPSAVNFCVFGAKAWVLTDPCDAGFYDGPTLSWWRAEVLKKGGSAARVRNHSSALKGYACERQQPRFVVIQGPGDIVYIPSHWGHGVINLADSLALAFESLLRET